jgi:hypothetical protein
MADEIDLNSDQVSQNLYADSDLAPLSQLFDEMGSDRSSWRKFGQGLNDLLDIATLGIPAVFRI